VSEIGDVPRDDQVKLRRLRTRNLDVVLEVRTGQGKGSFQDGPVHRDKDAAAQALLNC
jgi:hypothetical protein